VIEGTLLGLYFRWICFPKR